MINHDKSEYDESNKERKEKFLMDISYDFFCSNHSYMLGSFCLFQRSTIWK